MKSWQRWCVSNILSVKKLLSCFKFIYLANLKAGHILTNLLRKSLIGKLKPFLEKWKVKSWCLPFHHTPSPLRPHPDVQDRSPIFATRTYYLERAIAKDLGEDWGGEVGDDREQDRHPGCVQDEEDNRLYVRFD